MSNDLDLDPKTTTFLFMDFQNGIVPMLGEGGAAIVARARAVLEAARSAGAAVAFVRVRLQARLSGGERRRTSPSSALKASGRLVIGSPGDRDHRAARAAPR